MGLTHVDPNDIIVESNVFTSYVSYKHIQNIININESVQTLLDNTFIANSISILARLHTVIWEIFMWKYSCN